MTDKPKVQIVFAPGALDQIEDQEALDAITAAVQALANGDPIPEGVEINAIEEMSDDDIAEIMANYMHLGDADFKRLHTALKEMDMETAMNLMTPPTAH